jgi:hypothetical protein
LQVAVRRRDESQSSNDEMCHETVTLGLGPVTHR